ncbi:RNA-directed DNA polymerase [Rhizobium leguminosarum bv. viciae]|uniref:RNA-directed DNA polymerase n=1 Tax=Rhizobium leguminosarum TaxID=384 RepID=UPI00103D2715|nr:RNA-directed DNA polymerase [Rhizobium leguminosarum]MBY5342130.1 RNA-directed DNA polymerase [Rhizobium leguminosarum]NKK53252.1 hypothetical protein [Rhizobium leguminosarum bv. viciae]TBY91371.1 RNA-directed DNA polymerase [Rhizobium leguminosarum bv. viciae]
MQRLNPTIETASKDYVLVQAWKKASKYIRYHNWFADTLELDYCAANLPDFLQSLSDEMRSGRWVSDPLRLVLAPKSQQWKTPQSRGLWKPAKRAEEVKVRPLAHVSLRDQVVSTALMLCIADIAETAQGDPRLPNRGGNSIRNVVSYGNRLFCDVTPDGVSNHRWGSSKLYRSFSEDYRAFVERPERVAQDLVDHSDGDIVIVQSDLSQFYDRVRPPLLMDKLGRLLGGIADSGFMNLASEVLNWRWHEEDEPAAQRYASQNGIEGFRQIALPQGLVSAGFFANIVMLDFDSVIAESTRWQVGRGVLLHDASRYVDDLRMVVTTPKGLSTQDVEAAALEWLKMLLEDTAPGLHPSHEKTQAAHFGGELRPLLRQSRKMARIQQSVSGGFDVSRGEEIIDAVQSLIRAQEHYSREIPENRKRAERNGRDKRLPVPDVKDATVARFAAARFRSTYRSLRPLLMDADEHRDLETQGSYTNQIELRSEITKNDLDEEARNFSLNLIQSWIENPSNVRLLRIGLDIWPSVDELNEVLGLIRPYLKIGDTPARRAALYCLSEIFKAGATETGFVKDTECLPSSLDLVAYRKRLAKEAVAVLRVQGDIPWYLRQQALLVIAVTGEKFDSQLMRTFTDDYDRGTWRYRALLQFLAGDFNEMTVEDLATFAVVARRSILNETEALRLVGQILDDEVLFEIGRRDAGFADELSVGRFPPDEPANLPSLNSLASNQWVLLSDYVQHCDDEHSLRHEIGVTSLLSALADLRKMKPLYEVLMPSSIEIQVRHEAKHSRVHRARLSNRPVSGPLAELYRVPAWCPPEERWRFQFGYLARFILTGTLDFTIVRKPSWREDEAIYRPTRSHWYQRTYGLHNGMEGFGDDWLAISEETEDLLYSLLAWPGCRERLNDGWVKYNPEEASAYLLDRLGTALRSVGQGTETLMLRVSAPLFNERMERPLKGCVVQTITPHTFDQSDLTVSTPNNRRKHRKHLAAALASVEKMLELRATHEEVEKRLDWLILPELAVHPEDVDRHLVPFARRHKTMILAGLTYEYLTPHRPAVNSAMWILPQMTPDRGLQMKMRRQGKKHLAALELGWEAANLIRSFRPCQWLVGYKWDNLDNERPLWLSGAICYDSTDLGLAADLRKLSDIFAIPALNRDVGTFDQMALALHYHMYQMVIVANNGRYGGSNAHIPKKEHYVKQVFHTHGQPQAAISFFEVKEIRDMIYRRHLGLNPAAGSSPEDAWKYPPANF